MQSMNVAQQARVAFLGIALVAIAVFTIGAPALAAPGNGHIASQTVIGPGMGGFSEPIVARFGDALGALGDLDGDGVPDLIAIAGSSHAHEQGLLWAVFLNSNGTVKADRRITAAPGSFPGTGNSVAAVGDLDGDGVTEVIVGTPNDDDGAENAGAVWILFLNSDATVKAAQKISMENGGFTGWLVQYGYFGRAVSGIGDVDGDGVNDVAVGAPYYPERVTANNGWWWQGQVWILLLNSDGTVKANRQITEGGGGFTGTLVEYELFGQSLAALGDLDGDGTPDLAVGAEHNPDGGPFVGAIWVLFLNPDGTVKQHQRISPTTGGFTGKLRDLEHFTHSLANVGDVDADGVVDLAVGHEEGPVWLLFLTSAGTVKTHQRLDNTAFSENFGWALAGLGDVNGDGLRDWAVADPSIHSAWIVFGDGAPNPPCTSTPSIGCEAATKAHFTVRRKSNDSANRLLWRWQGAQAGSMSFGDPASATTYALCVWDRNAGTPIATMSLVVPPGASWTSTTPAAFTYTDTDGAADGVYSIKLRRNTSGQTRLVLKARGSALPLAVPVSTSGYFTQDPNLTVQLLTGDGACWTADFPVGAGSSSKFGAKLP